MERLLDKENAKNCVRIEYQHRRDYEKFLYLHSHSSLLQLTFVYCAPKVGHKIAIL